MSAYSSVTETILQVGAWLRDVIANTASVPISGTITANEANDSLLLPPGSHTALAPSDSTDITAIASIGILVTVDGNLSIRGVTTSGTTVTIPVVAGQYVYGRFSRCMAATTATCVGLAP